MRLTDLQKEGLKAVSNGEVRLCRETILCRETLPFRRQTNWVWRHRSILPQVFTALKTKRLIMSEGKFKFGQGWSKAILTADGIEVYRGIK